MSEIIQVPLKDILLDPRLQMRETMDPDVIDEYAQDIFDLPPAKIIKGPKGEMWLTGGWHRFHAYKQKSQKTMPCTVREGTFFDALTEAAGENYGHGIRRTNEDKRRAVAALLSDPVWRERSNNMIAKACHVSDTFVAKVRETTEGSNVGTPSNTSNPPATRTGTDGKEYPVHPKKLGRPTILCPSCTHRVSIGRDARENCEACWALRNAHKAAQKRKPEDPPDFDEEEQSDEPDDQIVDDDGYAVPAKLREVFSEAPLFRSAALAMAKAAIAAEIVEKSVAYALEDRQAKKGSGDRRLYSAACRTAEQRMTEGRPAKVCCTDGCKKCGMKGFLTQKEIET